MNLLLYLLIMAVISILAVGGVTLWLNVRPIGRPVKVLKIEPNPFAKDPSPELVWELDFSEKRAQQKAWEQEWERGWFEALGDDRKEFVAQRDDGSRRWRLVVRLRVAEDLAVREGRPWEQRVFSRWRSDIVANPEREIPLETMDQIERYLETVERDRKRLGV